MKIPSSRLPVPLLLPFISPPRNSFSHKVKTKGGQGDLDHVFLEFYLWYCTLNYFEKYFTPTTLRTGKITHFLKKKKKRKSKQECVCVAWRGIIWEVQTLKNSISSPPPPPQNFRSSRTRGRTLRYKQLTGSNCRLPMDFFYIYISTQWSLFYEMECLKEGLPVFDKSEWDKEWQQRWNLLINRTLP